MAPGVATAWTKIFADWLSGTNATGDGDPLKAGADYLAAMRKEKRYIEDAWC